MFVETLAAIGCGIMFGTLTGLTPGIHINLVALIVLSLAASLGVQPILLGVFIISMAITHTYLDALPGIYLGAPDSDHALSVLPGHRLLLRGKGHVAVLSTLVGSLFCLMMAISLYPLFIFLMRLIHERIQAYIGFILIAIMCYMIFKEKSWRKRLLSLTLFFMAGSLGLIVLNMHSLSQPLFPLLSGLFGISLLLLSLANDSSIPKQQKICDAELEPKVICKAVSASTGMGFIAAFLPGFGSAQAAIIAQQLVGKLGDRGFLVLTGGINTANMLISIATAYTLHKARNGAIIVVNKLLGEITLSYVLIFLASALVVAGIATVLTLKMSRLFIKVMEKVNYRKLVISIIMFIVFLTFGFDGILGLYVLMVATSVGMLTGLLGIGKNHLMGCLLLPVILYFTL
ncbi:MAG: tripartite tricarboxylate transporter permease [Nanoarchaeota archaeon]|nr:tripartite tricarboxylate transporter permease [Nanoarchaeota archaeon]